VAVSPSVINDTSIKSGTVTFEVNVTNAPSISGFLVYLQFDPTVVDFQRVGPSYVGLDFANNNIFAGKSTFTLFECIDAYSLTGGNCSPFDGLGVVSLGLQISGGATVSPTNGELFNSTLQVKGTGVSQMHIISSLLINNGVQIPNTSVDGYFSNKQCGTKICQPPIADLTYPMILPQGSPGTFDASKSYSPNPGASIILYSWAWGPGSRLTETEVTFPVVQQAYPASFNYTLTLTVTDSLGIKGLTSKPIQITNKIIDTGIASLDVEPVFNVLPGTDVNITVRAHNYGTQLWNITVSLSVDGKPVNQTFYPNVARFHDAATLVYIWHTTGKAPNAYRIDASVDPQPGDNNTNNDLTSTYVQIIEPRQSSLVNLALLPATFLGIILIVAGGASVSFIRRKLRPDLDAL
jgi:hypothetical protein